LIPGQRHDSGTPYRRLVIIAAPPADGHAYARHSQFVIVGAGIGWMAARFDRDRAKTQDDAAILPGPR
jgi:hypothetical protein